MSAFKRPAPFVLAGAAAALVAGLASPAAAAPLARATSAAGSWTITRGGAATAVTGALTGLHLAISVPRLGCTAVADGTSAKADDGVLAATYDNKTARLTALRSGGDLRVFDVSNCYGVVKDGDSIALSASYAVLRRSGSPAPSAWGSCPRGP